tara:strand:- start:18 stop:200 length:183 start_codon:yes stop_codon:yes gene_type:complete
MGFKKIIEEYNKEVEPRINEIIKYFENNSDSISISNLQRQFHFGYRRATRAKKQLKEIME